MNDQEPVEDLLERHRRAEVDHAQRQLATNADLIQRFKAFAATVGVRLSEDCFSYIPTIGMVACAPGLTAALLCNVEEERDKLYRFDVLTHSFSCRRHQAGYLRSSNFMLMAHPHFRRGFHGVNNFSPRFIELFWEFYDPAVVKYMSLDDERVRINVDDSTYMEFDTWYGAPFDKSVKQVEVGVVKLRPPLDLEDTYLSFFFADAYTLDIMWSQVGDIKTFQALEFKSEKVQIADGGRAYHPARYLHAEFDLRSGCFRHFDGAVQYYTEPEYLARRDSDFNYSAKGHSHIKARSRKLFKFNGLVNVDDWVEFCCHYLTGNPLIFEYFTGQYPAHIIDALTKIRAREARQRDA